MQRGPERLKLLRRLDPRIKFLGTLVWLLGILLISSDAWPVFAIYSIAALLLAWAAGLGLERFMKRTLVFLPFVLAAAGIIAMFWPGESQIRLMGLGLTREGLSLAWSFILKLTASYLAIQHLLVSTTVLQLIATLRSLRFPEPLIQVIFFLHCRLKSLVGESRVLKRARRNRFASVTSLRMGRLFGMENWRVLFLRSNLRMESMVRSMYSRGFQGKVPAVTLGRPGLHDVLYGLTVLVLAVAGAFLSKYTAGII